MKIHIPEEMKSLSVKIEKWMEIYLENYPFASSTLEEAMKYSLFAGGKRMRPFLVILSGNLFNVEEKLLYPTGAALEMIHTYTLIHDDLPCMDDDSLRRGKPTNHKVFGEAYALLAGNSLFTLGLEILVSQNLKLGFSPESINRMMKKVCRDMGASGVMAGQVLDIQNEQKEVHETVLKRVHELKTARLIQSSLACGAILGKANKKTLQQIEKFGHCLGMVFQITDDILDFTSSTEILGKETGSDEKHQKTTYPMLYARNSSIKEGIQRAILEADLWMNQGIQSLSEISLNTEHLEELMKWVRNRTH